MMESWTRQGVRSSAFSVCAEQGKLDRQGNPANTTKQRPVMTKQKHCFYKRTLLPIHIKARRKGTMRTKGRKNTAGSAMSVCIVMIFVSLC
jgi:hypothetical protein